MPKYLSIADHTKMILDDKNLHLSENDRMILFGLIAVHLARYAEQEMELYIEKTLA